jgi:hypothetical protein
MDAPGGESTVLGALSASTAPPGSTESPPALASVGASGRHFLNALLNVNLFSVQCIEVDGGEREAVYEEVGTLLCARLEKLQGV